MPTFTPIDDDTQPASICDRDAIMAREEEPPSKEIEVFSCNESTSVITDMETVQYETYNNRMYPSALDMIHALDNSEDRRNQVIQGIGNNKANNTTKDDCDKQLDSAPPCSVTEKSSNRIQETQPLEDEFSAFHKDSNPNAESSALVKDELTPRADPTSDPTSTRQEIPEKNRKPGMEGKLNAARVILSDDGIKADIKRSINLGSEVGDSARKQDSQANGKLSKFSSPETQIAEGGSSTFSRIMSLQSGENSNNSQQFAIGVPEADVTPGAHHVPGFMRGSPPQEQMVDPSLPQEANNVSGSLLSEGRTTESSATDGLVVANVVEETLELPHAEGYDMEAAKQLEQQDTEKREKTKKRLTCLSLALMVLTVVGIALGLTLSGKSSDHNDPQQAVSPGPYIPSTAAPTSFEGHLKSLLPAETLVSMEDADSAQSQAFLWLLEDLDQNPHQAEHQIKQRFALASFYFATGGDMWVNNDQWLDHNAHECEWFQKESFALQSTLRYIYPGYLDEFFPPAGRPPSRCNNQGLLLTLWLDVNNLAGSLPLELYMLTALQTVSFKWNAELKGPLSSHIGKLSALEGFFSFGLKDAGLIPSEIGLLTNMRGIGLYQSEHEGTIPNEFWQLTNLETFVLGGTPHPGGTISSFIGTLSNLRWIHLTETHMTGSIPTQIGLLSKLVWCTMEQQRLMGPLPSELGLLSKLTLLSLWDNRLTGSIPTEFGLLTSSTLLTVVKNQLIGTIPSQLGLLTALTELLDLGNPGLSGTVPTQLGLLTNLEELSLRDSILSGPIPSQLGLLTRLEWLGLQNNLFTATIPNHLSVLNETLYLLNLQGNPRLAGTIPSSLCALNNTCMESSLKHCETEQGTLFECTESFCGCNCSTCVGNNTN